MKQNYKFFFNQLNVSELKRHIVELGALERGQTFTNYHKAAQYVYNLAKEAGLPNVELLSFPADGKTTYLDNTQPLGWDATMGRLSIDAPLSGPGWTPVGTIGKQEERVLADFSKNPFHLVKGSVSTPEGGIHTRIVQEQQFLMGADVRGAMVMLKHTTMPRGSVVKRLLDQGALGVVSDYLPGWIDTPDCVHWLNAGTETSNWHVIAEDRPFISFNVTPRTGEQIRAKGSFKVLVESDGKRHEDTIDMVTALIPGRQKKELWVIAHMYEPLLDDDASGVVSGIEIARQILQKGTPEYSIRLVFAMEYYGYTAYVAHLGGHLHDRVIGGINIDTLFYRKEAQIQLYQSGPGFPFIGDELLKQIAEELKDELPLILRPHAYMDDCFLSDSTIGVPTIWLLGGDGGFWHNSCKCNPDFIEEETLQKSFAFGATFIDAVANYTGPEVKEPVYEIKSVDSPWRNYAAQMVFARKTIGTPHSMAHIPKEERCSLPSALYSPFGNVLSHTDGQRNVKELIELAEAESETSLSEATVKKYIDGLNFMADWGYLTAIKRPVITEEEIITTLKKLGVTEQDVLMVHASISKCGYIKGGAETIINAIRKCCRSCIFTTFTRPYIFLGGPNGDWRYRPYDPKDIEAIWTGNIGKVLLRKFPDAVRSKHVTHSWAGLGPDAHFLLDAHGAIESPAGINSPMAKAIELNAKILHFGSDLDSTSAVHYLEDITDMPFLETALCKVKNPDGSLVTVAIPKHLPGDRDFYRKDVENCKFFNRAQERGLKLNVLPLGMGKLKLLPAKELTTIGLQLLKEDPTVLLCDNPQCGFCKRFK